MSSDPDLEDAYMPFVCPIQDQITSHVHMNHYENHACLNANGDSSKL